MRTKIYLSIFIVALVVTVQFVPLHGMPSGDPSFARKLFLVLGATILLIVAFAKVFHCPRCGADTGRFIGRFSGQISKNRNFR